MKSIILLLNIVFLIFNLQAQEKDSSKLKLNSFGVDYYLSNNLAKHPKVSTIKSYYKNPNEFVNIINEDSIKVLYPNSTSFIGVTSFSISAGFTPYSKNNNKYLNNQEIIFGGSFLSTFTPEIFNSYNSLDKVLDTVNEYTVSQQTGDTLESKTYYEKIIETQIENYFYTGKKVMIFSEWFFKTNPSKRFVFSIAPGLRLSYIYQAKILHYFAVNSSVGYVNQVNDENFTKKHLDDEILVSDDGYYQAKNGFAIEPYLKAKIEMRLSMENNFFNHLSININSYFGSTFNMIFSTKTTFQTLYGGGIGLKYTL